MSHNNTPERKYFIDISATKYVTDKSPDKLQYTQNAVPEVRYYTNLSATRYYTNRSSEIRDINDTPSNTICNCSRYGYGYGYGNNHNKKYKIPKMKD